MSARLEQLIIQSNQFLREREFAAANQPEEIQALAKIARAIELLRQGLAQIAAVEARLPSPESSPARVDGHSHA